MSRWIAPLAVLMVLVAAPLAVAAPTPEQRAEIGAIGTLITKAGNLYKDGKYKDAADVVKEAQTRVEKLAEGADGQLVTQLTPAHKRLTNAHALLELEGITLNELKPLEAKPKAGTPGAGGTVSFVKTVAPILNSRCGGCHVRNARGMFSMASYESLMTGPPAGKVVFPANVPGSDLIVKVEDKEMPPNGAGIPADELATLKKWVEEGAKFDGPDPKAQLTTFVAAGTPAPATPMISVQMATGKETVSFSKDIAPIFVGTCTGCHGGNNPRGNLSLLTIESMFRGGDRGEPILPTKPADSLLVKKLKGTADGARMPMGQTPLDDATIAKVEKWIEEGAKFDGPNVKQPIAEVAAIAKAKDQTHDELAADRAKLADSNWRLAMAAVQPTRAETTNFVIVGNVMENVLKDIAQQAETQAPKVAAIFKAPADQPLVKGKMTLFVLAERYDYGEFGKMVEKRDLPPSWRGHHRYTVVDAYAAIFPSRQSEFSNESLIAQQIGALYVASLGTGVPRWFSEGTGRVVATRMTPADARVRVWDDQLPRVFAGMTAPDDFMTGKLPPEDSDLASYSFVKFLMADGRKHNVLLDGLRKGGDFGKVFLDTYGAGPAQVAQVWARSKK